MTDTRKELERQAAWQKARVALTWPEKIRMAQAVREWAANFCRARPPVADSGSAQRPPGTSDAHASEGREDK